MYNFLGLYHWDDSVTEFQQQLDAALVALKNARLIIMDEFNENEEDAMSSIFWQYNFDQVLLNAFVLIKMFQHLLIHKIRLHYSFNLKIFNYLYQLRNPSPGNLSFNAHIQILNGILVWSTYRQLAFHLTVALYEMMVHLLILHSWICPICLVQLLLIVHGWHSIANAAKSSNVWPDSTN